MNTNEFDIYPTNGVEISKMNITFHPAFFLNKMAKNEKSIKSDLDRVMELTDLKKRHELLMHPEIFLPDVSLNKDMVLDYSVKNGFNNDLETLLSRIPEFEMENRESKNNGDKPKQSYTMKPSMSSNKKKPKEENKIKITPFPRKPLI